MLGLLDVLAVLDDRELLDVDTDLFERPDTVAGVEEEDEDVLLLVLGLPDTLDFLSFSVSQIRIIEAGGKIVSLLLIFDFKRLNQEIFRQ